MTGIIGWLSQGAWPDLFYTTLQLSKKNTFAAIADLRGMKSVGKDQILN